MMQSRCSIKVARYFFGLDGTNRSVISAGILLLWSGQWVGWLGDGDGGGVEKLRLKLTSAKVEVEVELGNMSTRQLFLWPLL